MAPSCIVSPKLYVEKLEADSCMVHRSHDRNFSSLGLFILPPLLVTPQARLLSLWSSEQHPSDILTGAFVLLIT